MRYALVGYGRTGREIDRQAKLRGHRRVRIVDPAYRGREGSSGIDAGALAHAEVAFEFTEPAAAADNVLALVRAGLSVVCGTTGWKPGTGLRREVESSGCGVVVAPNFSVGMNLFYLLARYAARTVGSAGLHEPYVTECHHRGKVDAPSGTAARLAGIVSRADPRKPGVLAGNPEGRLPANTVHVASLRAGSEPGRHVVGFDGEHDVIELTHSNRGRAGLAQGAVLAGEWVLGRKGWFSFEPVLRDLLQEGRKS